MLAITNAGPTTRCALGRRRFLAGAACLLTRSVLPDAPAKTSPENVPPDAPFRFVEFNDTHMRDHDCVFFLRKAVARIHSLAEESSPPQKSPGLPIDFALLPGDLATDGRSREFELLKPIVKELQMPLHVVPGNHDYQGNDRSAYDRAFPGKTNYSFVHKGWQFIGFDSTAKLIEAMERGELHGLIIQNPFRMGYEGVYAAVRHLRGEEVPQRIDTGVVFADPGNMHEPDISDLLTPDLDRWLK